MKSSLLLPISLILVPLVSTAEDVPSDHQALVAKHAAGADELANDQDELAADVVDMIEQQTAKNVIETLTEVEVIMGETIDRLDQKQTGSDTLAAQTEIIEKIFEAAEKRQEQSEKEKEEQEGEGEPEDGQGKQDGEDKPGEGKPGQGKGQGKPGSAMLEMMRRMMQEGGDGKKPGKKPSEGEDKGGDKAGEGNTGDSDSPNDQFDGPVEGVKEARTVPRSSGTSPESLPREFHKALDAYNRALREEAR